MDSITFDRFAETLIGAENVLKIPTDCAPYEQGWRYGHGKAFRVLKPGTVEEVQAIVAFCNEHEIPLVPQGGNTGLVAASVPDSSAHQVVLSLSRLNKHIHIDAEKKQVCVSAGVILDVLNDMLEMHRLWLPIDIGSSGSCQIGGMVATNAAGTRAGRYGAVRDRLLSMKVVLADGSIKSMEYMTAPVARSTLSEAIKQDNSQLLEESPFCGSSGWLGVVVEASFALEPLPKGTTSALLLPAEGVDIDALVMRILEDAAEHLSALEGVSDLALHMVAESVADLPYLFESEAITEHRNAYALLMEFSSATEGSEMLQVEIETLLMRYMDEGLLQTARADKPTLFWQVRHAISEAIRHYGEVIACDIAVPVGRLAQFRQQAAAALKARWPYVQIVPFGHEMLGACHYNIIWPKKVIKKLTTAVREDIKRTVYDIAVGEFGGTFSAEHGIGPHNQHYYDLFASDKQKTLAKQLKLRYDPKRIMNPNLHFD